MLGSGCGCTVVLYRLQTMCLWWTIRDLVEPQVWGNTIDLWLRNVWMICNCGMVMTGSDSRFCASSAVFQVRSCAA
jgi:hypothetical protein